MASPSREAPLQSVASEASSSGMLHGAVAISLLPPTASPSPPYRIQPIVSAQRLARRSSLLRNASATAAHAHAATATAGRVLALQRACGSAM